MKWRRDRMPLTWFSCAMSLNKRGVGSKQLQRHIVVDRERGQHPVRAVLDEIDEGVAAMRCTVKIVVEPGCFPRRIRCSGVEQLQCVASIAVDDKIVVA